MKIAMLGAGAWGTALARMLASRKLDGTLWDFFPQTIEAIRQTGRNERYLPGIELPKGLKTEADANSAIASADLVAVASVSNGFRAVTKCLGAFRGVVVSVTKGIEFETGNTMSDILEENAPLARIVAMSGPTLAMGGTFQSNVEFVVFARRGSLPALSKQTTRWYRWPRSEHSAKPEAFLDLVEAVSPAPRLEMFARRNRLGWDTWGNEALEHVELTA